MAVYDDEKPAQGASGLDGVRQAEQGAAGANGGGFWKPHGSAAGKASGGAKDSTGIREGGATDTTGSSEGGSGSSAGLVPSLKNSEELADGGLASGFDESSNSSGGFRRRFKITKQKAVIGIGSATVAGVTFGFLSISSGPLEFIHFAQLLEKFHFSSQQNTADNRLMKLARYVHEPDKPQNIRLGIVGNKIANHYTRVLETKAGMKPVYDGTRLNFGTGYELDLNHRNWAGQNESVIRGRLAADYGFPPESIKITTGQNGKVTKVFLDFNFSKITPLNFYKQTSYYRGVLRGAGLSWLSARVGARVESKRMGWPFHPLQKYDSKILNSALDLGSKGLDKLKEKLKGDRAKMIDPSITGNPPTPDERKKAQDKFKAKVATTAGITSLICIANGIQGDIQTAKFTKAVLPMARMGGQIISAGSQAQSGQDLSAVQLGVYKDFLTQKDSNGKVLSTWNQADSIRAELGQPVSANGKNDIPQAGRVFQGSPFDDVMNFINSVPGVSVLTGFFCGIGGAVVGGLGGAIQSLVLGPLISAFSSAVADWSTGAPVDPNAAGSDYGNYANYGARVAANDQFTSAGGLKLNSKDELALKNINNKLDTAEFQSQSLAYRLFNPDDSRTLMAHFIDNQTPSATANLANMLSGFSSIFSSVLKAPGTLFSSVAHATPSTYNYHGLQASGFKVSDLVNSKFENPYDNGCYVSGDCNLSNGTHISAANSILGINGQQSFTQALYLQRIQACFGDQVTYDTTQNQWTIAYFGSSGAVDIYSSSYSGENDCFSTDTDWSRLRFWLLDTATLESYDCSQSATDTAGQSCTDMGFGNQGSSSGATLISSSGCTNPFPGGWSPSRLDMGFDGTFKKQIVAPCSGTITYASDSFSNWGGYIMLKLDQKPSGFPTSTIFFAEGITPIVRSGHVNAGQPIANPATNHFNGIVGNIEWGMSQDGSQGSPANTYVYGRCGSAAARQSVLDFAKWAQSLAPGAPTSTGTAGCP